MKKFFLFALALFAIFYISFLSLKTRLGDQTVELNGKIGATIISINSPFSGTVNRIYYKNGENVVEGDKLFTIDVYKSPTTSIATEDTVTNLEGNDTIATALVSTAGSITDSVDIIAPDSGTIVSSSFNQGDSIISNNNILRILIKDSYFIQAEVPFDYLSNVQIGSEINWKVPNSIVLNKAQVIYIDPILNEANRVKITLGIRETNQELIINQQVILSFTIQREDNILGITIPDSSILHKLLNN